MKTLLGIFMAAVLVAVPSPKAGPTELAACPTLECDGSYFFHNWEGNSGSDLDCKGGDDEGDQTCHNGTKGGSCASKHPVCTPQDLDLDGVEAALESKHFDMAMMLIAGSTVHGSYSRASGRLTLSGCNGGTMMSFPIDGAIVEAFADSDVLLLD